MIYSKEVQEMCQVAKGPNHGPAPIPEEGKWVKAKEIADISGMTHGIGWCAPQQGACKLSLNVKNGIIEEALVETIGCSGMTHSAAMASEILERSTDNETTLRESRLCTTIDDLLEQLTHCGIDSIANEVSVQCLQDGLARENLRSHRCRVSHTRATDSLNQSLLNDTLFNVESKFARTLLWSAPTNTVSKTGDILNLLSAHPLALLRNWS